MSRPEIEQNQVGERIVAAMAGRPVAEIVPLKMSRA